MSTLISVGLYLDIMSLSETVSTLMRSLLSASIKECSPLFSPRFTQNLTFPSDVPTTALLRGAEGERNRAKFFRLLHSRRQIDPPQGSYDINGRKFFRYSSLIFLKPCFPLPYHLKKSLWHRTNLRCRFVYQCCCRRSEHCYPGEGCTFIYCTLNIRGRTWSENSKQFPYPFVPHTGHHLAGSPTLSSFLDTQSQAK